MSDHPDLLKAFEYAGARLGEDVLVALAAATARPETDAMAINLLVAFGMQARALGLKRLPIVPTMDGTIQLRFPEGGSTAFSEDGLGDLSVALDRDGITFIDDGKGYPPIVLRVSARDVLSNYTAVLAVFRKLGPSQPGTWIRAAAQREAVSEAQGALPSTVRTALNAAVGLGNASGPAGDENDFTFPVEAHAIRAFVAFHRKANEVAEIEMTPNRDVYGNLSVRLAYDEEQIDIDFLRDGTTTFEHSGTRGLYSGPLNLEREFGPSPAVDMRKHVARAAKAARTPCDEAGQPEPMATRR